VLEALSGRFDRAHCVVEHSWFFMLKALGNMMFLSRNISATMDASLLVPKGK